MSKIVLDSIDAAIAALVPVVKTPTGELGYGVDLSCVTDVTPELAEVDPFSTRGIGEAALRRLTTTRGTLPDDPHYGLDVGGYLNRGVPISELRDLAGAIRGELTKDDRIAVAGVSVTIPEPNALRVAITITPTNPRLAPFPLIFALTADGALTVETIS